MSTPVSSPRQSGPALRRASWPGSQLRVGDAERAAIADRLAHHFSEGRLDEAEFNSRLDRAMGATTMADLTGLLADLPDAEPGQPELPAGGRRHQRKLAQVRLEREQLRLKHERRENRRAEHQRRAHSLRGLALIAVLAVVIAIVVHELTHSVGAWLVIGLIAFLWLRRNNGGYRGS